MKDFILNRNLILLLILILLFLIVGFINPLFLNYASFLDILNDTSILIILALGQMFVILIRAIDLSVASNLALSGMIISLLSQINPDIPVFFFIIISCFIGALLGLFNGVLIGYLKVPFIITTLGTLSVYRGLIYFISDGKQIYAHECPLLKRNIQMIPSTQLRESKASDQPLAVSIAGKPDHLYQRKYQKPLPFLRSATFAPTAIHQAR